MITILKPDVATGHFESVICRVLCRIVIVVMRASWRYKVCIWLFFKSYFFPFWCLKFTGPEKLCEWAGQQHLTNGLWYFWFWLIDLKLNFIVEKKVEQKLLSYEAAPTEDIRFTILLRAPLMINTLFYHNIELRTEMMKLKIVLSVLKQSLKAAWLLPDFPVHVRINATDHFTDCECRECVYSTLLVEDRNIYILMSGKFHA